MEKEASQENPEPTLNDLMEVMVGGFSRVEGEIQELRTGVTGLKSETHELTRRTGSLETKVEDMHETLTAMSKAVDKDATTLISHTTRIQRIEKVLELPAV